MDTKKPIPLPPAPALRKWINAYSPNSVWYNWRGEWSYGSKPGARTQAFSLQQELTRVFQELKDKPDYAFDYTFISDAHHYFVPLAGDPSRGLPADMIAATDCMGNFYWGEALRQYSEFILFGVVMHEIMHNARGDAFYLKLAKANHAQGKPNALDPQILNIAQDYAINTGIYLEIKSDNAFRANGFYEAPFGLELDQLHGKSLALNVPVDRLIYRRGSDVSHTEMWYYEYMADAVKNKNPQNRPNKSTPTGEGPLTDAVDPSPYSDSKQEQEPTLEEQMQAHQQQVQRALDKHAQAQKANVHQSTPDKSHKSHNPNGTKTTALNDLVNDSKHAALGISGDTADRIVSVINHIKLRTNINWMQRIKRQISNNLTQGQANHDFTYTRYNRRSQSAGYILPKLHTTLSESIVLMVDTSGSINTELLYKMIGATNEVRKTFHSATFHTVWCHSDIWRTDTTTGPQPIEVPKKITTGGTSFKPPFEWVTDQRALGKLERPAVAIYFTDMNGGFPLEAPDYPVYWVLYGGASSWVNVPAWITPDRVIVIDSGGE